MKKLFLALMAIAAIALTGCEKKSDGTSGGTSEKVKTISATDITPSGALLMGQVGVEIADYKSMEFGMLISENESDVSSYEGKKLVGDKLLGQTFSITANGLSAETKYYYRAYLILNNMQYEYGDIKSFKTERPLLPILTTTEVTNVSSCSATCGGNVSYDGGATVTERGICYSTSQNPTTSSTKLSSGSGKGMFSVNLSDLKENTTYYVRAYAINAKGTNYGNQVTFTTMASSGTESGHEWVDLGLSVAWATCNVGATTPEEYGDYFAWGETYPKDFYAVVDSIPPGHHSELQPDLAPEDDAAHVNWGGNWRMPTRAELDELQNNCTWTWTTQNGVNGYLVKSKKNSNSIFLPASGYRGGSSLYNVGSYGGYWSSSLYDYYSSYAYYLYFNSDNVGLGSYYRYYGQSVRAVCQ